MRQGAAAAMLLAAGCGASAPPPARPVILSTQNSRANVAPIVEFFRRTCLEAATDGPRFAAAVAASGWPLRQTQTQILIEPSHWRFDHGELIWFHTRAMNDCFLTLDSLVAPTPAAIGTALRPFVQRPHFEDLTEDEGQVVWAWPAGSNQRMVLTIAVLPASPGRTYGAGRQAVSLQLASEPMPAASAERD